MFSRAYRTAVTLPPLLWVMLFLLAPYLLMFCYGFWSVSPSQTIVHSWTLDNYRELLRVNAYWQTLLRSMWIAARVTLFSLLLGYPLAYFLSFHAGARKHVFYQLVIIPLWVSYLVRAYAWKTILGSAGVLNTLLQYAHLTSTRSSSCCTVRSRWCSRSRISIRPSLFCRSMPHWSISPAPWWR